MNFETTQHPEFDGHHNLNFVHDRVTGLRAIIAIHRSGELFAAGGIRMQPYPDTATALTDVLRLSRAMTYKMAAAELPVGGAKSVIIGDPALDKSPALLAAFGEAVNRLGGSYRCGGDVGIGSDDIAELSKTCRYTPPQKLGDISIPTAEGVFHAIRAGVTCGMGRDSLQDVRIAIQGVGAVGARLAALLVDAGSEVMVADVDESRCNKLAERIGASVIPVADCLSVDADVISPCALGGILKHDAVDAMQARVVCGAANNQLLTEDVTVLLQAKEIFYVPDFVANAGGVIGGLQIDCNYTAAESNARVQGIYDKVLKVAELANSRNCTTDQAAHQLARAFIGEQE